MSKPEMAGEEASQQAAEGVKAAIHAGTEAARDAVKKAFRNYDELLAHGKENAAAVADCASASVKGAESLQEEFFSYSQRAVEHAIGAANAAFSAKSIAEVAQLQRAFVTSAFQAYTDEVTKLSEIWLDSARASYDPLKGRVRAWLDVVQRAPAG